MDSSRGSRFTVQEIPTDVAEIERKLDLGQKPENVIELLQSHDKAGMDKELFLADEQRKQFLEIKSTPCEDAVKIVKMTRDLEHYVEHPSICLFTICISSLLRYLSGSFSHCLTRFFSFLIVEL